MQVCYSPPLTPISESQATADTPCLSKKSFFHYTKEVITHLDPTATVLRIALYAAQIISVVAETLFSLSQTASSYIAKLVPWVGFVNIPHSLYTIYEEVSLLLKGTPQEQNGAPLRIMNEIGYLIGYGLNCVIALVRFNSLPQHVLSYTGPLSFLSSILSAFGCAVHYAAWEEAEELLDVLQIEGEITPEKYRQTLSKIQNYQLQERKFIDRHFCPVKKFHVLYQDKLIQQFEKAFQSSTQEKEAAQAKMQEIMIRLRERVKAECFSEKMESVIHAIYFSTGLIFAFTPFFYVGVALTIATIFIDITRSSYRYLEKKRFESFLQGLPAH